MAPVSESILANAIVVLFLGHRLLFCVLDILWNVEKRMQRQLLTLRPTEPSTRQQRLIPKMYGMDLDTYCCQTNKKPGKPHLQAKQKARQPINITNAKNMKHSKTCNQHMRHSKICNPNMHHIKICKNVDLICSGLLVSVSWPFSNNDEYKTTKLT